MRRILEISFRYESAQPLSTSDVLRFLVRAAIHAAIGLIALSLVASRCDAGLVTFGSGLDQFVMEFVTIGNANNTADTRPTANPNPAGGVGYTYEMGKFEVSRDMITKYNTAFGNTNSLAISLADMTPYGGNGANKPATGVSWNEAARFVNWLNTSTGNQAAYKFALGSGVNDNIQMWGSGDAGYDAYNPYRNRLAKYALPSYNEWYKAAYYNPLTSTYFDYSTLNGLVPTATSSGTTANTAVYFQPGPTGPADVNLAGGESPSGVVGLGGNVREWEESSFDLLNASVTAPRGIRGGTWFDGSSYLLSSNRFNDVQPNGKDLTVGFRVTAISSTTAAIPEPSALVFTALLGLGGLVSKSRRLILRPGHTLLRDL